MFYCKLRNITKVCGLCLSHLQVIVSVISVFGNTISPDHHFTNIICEILVKSPGLFISWSVLHWTLTGI